TWVTSEIACQTLPLPLLRLLPLRPLLLPRRNHHSLHRTRPYPPPPLTNQ
ncbi:unnamed protein product, partial [Closterium sp. NIES-53]